MLSRKDVVSLAISGAFEVLHGWYGHANEQYLAQKRAEWPELFEAEETEHLTRACPSCKVPPGTQCHVIGNPDKPSRPHLKRRDLRSVLRAMIDNALDHVEAEEA